MITLRTADQLKVIVHLTGGLGNQLFQVAAALSLNPNKINLMTLYGDPRGIDNSKPDLTHYNLPDNIEIMSEQKKSRLIQKVISMMIRISADYSGSNKAQVLKFCLQKFGSLFLSLLFKIKLNVYICNGIGYSGKIPRKKGTTLLIGYFQCHPYFEELKVNKVLRTIKPKKTSSNVQLAQRYFNENSILIMHVRLGDYRFEKAFGTLSQDYYKRALLFMNHQVHFDQIWLFSDEIESAKLLIPESAHDKLKILDNCGLSAGEVLELMRYGHGYIIANSSLSWWAASLSHAKNPLVVAPSPWFKQIGTPNKLIPDNWNTLKI